MGRKETMRFGTNDFYQQLVGNLPVAYASHRILRDGDGCPCDYEFLDINAAFETMTGLCRQDILGKRVTDVLPGIAADGFDWIGVYGEVASGRGPREFEAYSEPLGRWYRVVAFSPGADCFCTLFYDVSGDKERIEEMRKLVGLSGRLLEMEGAELDCQGVLEEFSALCGASFAVCNLFSQDRKKLVTKAVCGDGDLLGKAKELLGGDILEMQWEPPAALMEMEEAATVERISSLAEVMAGQIPPEELERLGDTLGCGDIVGIVIRKGSLMLGTILLFMPEGVSFGKDSAAGVFAGQLGVAIERSRALSQQQAAEQALRESQEKYSSYIQNALDGVFVADRTGQIVEVNRAAQEITGYSQEELLERTVDDLLAPGYRESELHLIEELIRSGSATVTVQFRHRSGQTRWGHLNAVRIREDRFLGLANDITQIKEAEERMRYLEEEQRKGRERLEDILEATRAGTWDWEIDTGDVELNERSAGILGYTQARLFPVTMEAWYRRIHPADRKGARNQLRLVLAGQKEYYDAEFRMEHKDSRWVWVLARGRVSSWSPDRNPLRLSGTLLDVTDRKEVEEDLLYLSYHDPLTGLYNRAFYEEELKRLDTPRNLPLTLMLVDVDNLKLFNDGFGHLAGDELLRKIAGILKEECRADEITARIGGDEFALIFPQTGAGSVEKIAERIRAAVSRHPVRSLTVTVSIGLETKERPDRSIEDVFNVAEERMYRQKMAGQLGHRGRIVERISETLCQKDANRREHTRKVGELSAAIGRAMGLDPERVESLRSLGFVHDIGNIAVDPEILAKEGPLTQKEWTVIQQHPETGYRILGAISELSHLSESVLSHHERWDGNGYPRGLRENQIPLEARILAVADAYDSMTTDLPYRAALSEEEARQIIGDGAGTQFDPRVVGVFFSAVGGPIERRWPCGTRNARDARSGRVAPHQSIRKLQNARAPRKDRMDITTPAMASPLCLPVRVMASMEKMKAMTARSISR